LISCEPIALRAGKGKKEDVLIYSAFEADLKRQRGAMIDAAKEKTAFAAVGPRNA